MHTTMYHTGRSHGRWRKRTRAGTTIVFLAVAVTVVPNGDGGRGIAGGPEDAAAAREEVKGQIEAAKVRTREALEVFLDRSQPTEERMRAGAEIGYVARSEDASALAEVLRDRNEPETIRVMAMKHAPAYYRQTVLDEAIDIIQSPENGGPKLKEASVDKLVLLAQFSPHHHDSSAKIFNALRIALRSPSPPVREDAMSFLAVKNDPVAIRILEESLAEPDTALFSNPDAIRYLSMRDPRPHFETLRPFLADPDPATRDAAVRALRQDPESRLEIERLQHE